MSGSFEQRSPHIIIAIQDWKEYENLGSSKREKKTKGDTESKHGKKKDGESMNKDGESKKNDGKSNKKEELDDVEELPDADDEEEKLDDDVEEQRKQYIMPFATQERIQTCLNSKGPATSPLPGPAPPAPPRL